MGEVETIEGEVVEQVGQALEVAREAPPPVNLFGTDDPAAVVAKASGVASVLAEVLRKQRLTATIGRGEHVLVEGWTLLGTMLGVFPVCVWTRPLHNPDGWEARVEARTLSGVVVGAAEAECLRTENTWRSRDDYALRSMAQTRATSKALRQPLGFVVTLAGFDPTPAEEMPRNDATGTAGDSLGGSTRADKSTRAAGSWAGVKKVITQYGEATWDDWTAFGAQARQYMYPDAKELTKEQKAELLRVTAGAAAKLAETVDPGSFPPPTRAQMREAWKSVLDAELEGPSWSMSPDETDREAREAQSE